MPSFSQSQRAVLAFLLAVVLATAAGAVCVAFGTPVMSVPVAALGPGDAQPVSASRQALGRDVSLEAVRSQPAANGS